MHSVSEAATILSFSGVCANQFRPIMSWFWSHWSDKKNNMNSKKTFKAFCTVQGSSAPFCKFLNWINCSRPEPAGLCCCKCHRLQWMHWRAGLKHTKWMNTILIYIILIIMRFGIAVRASRFTAVLQQRYDDSHGQLLFKCYWILSISCSLPCCVHAEVPCKALDGRYKLVKPDE